MLSSAAEGARLVRTEVDVPDLVEVLRVCRLKPCDRVALCCFKRSFSIHCMWNRPGSCSCFGGPRRLFAIGSSSGIWRRGNPGCATADLVPDICLMSLGALFQKVIARGQSVLGTPAFSSSSVKSFSES